MNDESFSDLEDLIRSSAPKQLPEPLRARILETMDQPPEYMTSRSKILTFPVRWAAAVAAMVVLGGGLALLRETGADSRQPSTAQGNAPSQSSLALAPLAVTTHELDRGEVSPVINVAGRPLRMVETRQLETRSYQEPNSGAIVEVSYPQSSYQLVNVPIE